MNPLLADLVQIEQHDLWTTSLTISADIDIIFEIKGSQYQHTVVGSTFFRIQDLLSVWNTWWYFYVSWM